MIIIVLELQYTMSYIGLLALDLCISWLEQGDKASVQINIYLFYLSFLNKRATGTKQNLAKINTIGALHL